MFVIRRTFCIIVRLYECYSTFTQLLAHILKYLPKEETSSIICRISSTFAQIRICLKARNPTRKTTRTADMTEGTWHDCRVELVHSLNGFCCHSKPTAELMEFGVTENHFGLPTVGRNGNFAMSES